MYVRKTKDDRLEVYEKMRKFLTANKVFDLVDLVKYMLKPVATVKLLLRVVCPRFGIHLKALGKFTNGVKDRYEVISC